MQDLNALQLHLLIHPLSFYIAPKAFFEVLLVEITEYEQKSSFTTIADYQSSVLSNM